MLKLAHKGLLLVLIPVVFELAFVWQVGKLLADVDEQIGKEKVAADILMASENYFSDMMRGNAAAISYKAYGDQKYIALHEGTVQALVHDFQEMKRLSEGDPQMQAALAMVAKREGMAVKIRRMMMKSPEQARVSSLFGGRMIVRYFAASDLTQDPIMDVVNEENTLAERDSERRIADIQRTLQRWLIGGGIASLILTLLVGIFFQRQIYSRLKRVLINIHRMTRKEPLMPAAPGSDEISELDRAVVRTADEIAALEKFRKESAELMAAELQAPLQEVRTCLNEIQSDGFESLNEAGVERMKGAKTLVARLQTLVGDLESLDKITQARLQFNFEQCSLKSLVTAALDATTSIASSRGIVVRAQTDDTVQLVCDESRLTQVLINLLSNAIKFSPDGAEVKVEARHDGSGLARVSVHDQGKGIDTEFQSRIFHRFEQAGEADQAKGSGLGLSICREIVEAHGGTMDFSSKPGNTQFWFRVPLAPAQKPAPSESASAERMQRRRHALWRIALPVLLTPLVVQLSVVAVLYTLVERAHGQMEQFRHARQVASTCSDLSRQLMLASVTAMLYNSGARDEVLKQRFADREAVLQSDMTDLMQLTKGNVQDTQRANQLCETVSKGIHSTETLMNSAEHDMPLEQWAKKSPELLLIADPTSGLGAGFSDWITSNQNAQSQQLAMGAESRRHIMLILWGGLAVSIAVTIALAIVFVRGVCTRVSKIVANTRRLVNGEALTEPDSGWSDEIADVDREFYLAGRHLRELDQFKDELLSVTSHELRTPLTGLLGALDVITLGLYGKLTNHGEALAAQARQVTSDLISLITNFLDVEKMRSGKKLVTPAPTSIAELCKELNKVAVLPESPHPDFIINADVPRLMQALSVVVGEQSRLSIERSGDGTGRLTISRHTGGESNLRQQLNLALCRNVANQHGGRFEVEEEKLIFFLPSPTP